MARNAAGNFTLPTGNPVVSGGTIQATWANTTLADLALELTDSLSRSGKGGMLAPLLLTNGDVGSPGLGFASEPSSGFYRAGPLDARFVLNGAQRITMKAAAGSSAVELWSNQAADGDQPDFFMRTTNVRTAGSLFKIFNGGNEKFRIDYNGDIFKNGVLFSGSGGGGSAWSTFFLASDVAVSTTAADLSGMSFSMEANATYVVRAVLIGLSGDAAAYNATYRMKGSGAPAINYISLTTFQDSSGSAMQSETVSAVDTDWWSSNTDATGSGQSRTTWGIIKTGASAGTFQLQGRRTGGTANPTIRAGSYIEYHKV